ncbi:VanZ family protein [Micrococcus sp. Mcc89]|uniref:VanZ family protein n=1 Tax=Micrococcus sp. Mcc89 TaxID=2926014 RepID=UPI0021182263|nr:VanZ family protein [Micrococcus sp. Mcc89]
MTVPPGSPTTSASRRRRRALTAALAVAVVVQLVVLYLPGEQVPQAGFAVPGLDKAIHAAVFALPSCLAVWRGRSAWWALPFAVHAPVSELVQHAWVPLRTGDPVDVVADLAGVVLGVVAARRRRIGGSGAAGV